MLWEGRYTQHSKKNLYQTAHPKFTVSLFKVNFDLKKKNDITGSDITKAIENGVLLL